MLAVSATWIKKIVANKIHEVKRGGGGGEGLALSVIMTLISNNSFPRVYIGNKKNRLQGIKTTSPT